MSYTLSDDICNFSITIEKIITHLRKFKNNKASGTEGINGKFHKYVSDNLAFLLFFAYIHDFFIRKTVFCRFVIIMTIPLLVISMVISCITF